jgi:hypothetical protein
MLFIFLPLIGNAGAYGWDLSQNENDIQIYTRSVEGSGFKEYKGVMEIKASLASLVALVDDAAAYPRWIHTCIEGQTLKKINPAASYAYCVNDAPWPVSDRDAVTYHVTRQDAETLSVTISITGVPDFAPERPGLVRVRKIDGFWRFTPLEDGNVRIVYQVHNEPGGNIPQWLANAVVVTQPYRTLVNMQKWVKRPEYRGKKYDFIQEKVEDKPPALK